MFTKSILAAALLIVALLASSTAQDYPTPVSGEVKTADPESQVATGDVTGVKHSEAYIEPNAYDSEGYDPNGYDKEGYNRKGYDKSGHDKSYYYNTNSKNDGNTGDTNYYK